MNRCTTASPLGRRPLLAGLALALLACASGAFAQDSMRPFPPKAERGAMFLTSATELTMNGQPTRLSPGARIRGTNNMLVMSGALIGQNLLVNFVRESTGLVHEVWILNEAEARQVLPTGGITLVN